MAIFLMIVGFLIVAIAVEHWCKPDDPGRR